MTNLLAAAKGDRSLDRVAAHVDPACYADVADAIDPAPSLDRMPLLCLDPTLLVDMMLGRAPMPPVFLVSRVA